MNTIKFIKLIVFIKLMTTITITDETKERLAGVGNKGDSYDNIVSSLIEFYINEIKSRGDLNESGGSTQSN